MEESLFCSRAHPQPKRAKLTPNNLTPKCNSSSALGIHQRFEASSLYIMPPVSTLPFRVALQDFVRQKQEQRRGYVMDTTSLRYHLRWPLAAPPITCLVLTASLTFPDRGG